MQTQLSQVKNKRVRIEEINKVNIELKFIPPRKLDNSQLNNSRTRSTSTSLEY